VLVSGCVTPNETEPKIASFSQLPQAHHLSDRTSGSSPVRPRLIGSSPRATRGYPHAHLHQLSAERQNGTAVKREAGSGGAGVYGRLACHFAHYCLKDTRVFCVCLYPRDIYPRENVLYIVGLKYEPASEPLHISVKSSIENSTEAHLGTPRCGGSFIAEERDP